MYEPDVIVLYVLVEVIFFRLVHVIQHLARTLDTYFRSFNHEREREREHRQTTQRVPMKQNKGQ